MLDQAYDHGCEVALNELAETFGEDVVNELVKIAGKKDNYGEQAAAGAAGAGALGTGGFFGGRALGKHMNEATGKEGKGGNWAEKLKTRREGIWNKQLADSNKRSFTRPFKAPEVGEHAKKLEGRLSRMKAIGTHGKWGTMAAGALAGGAGAAYAAKKARE